MARRFDYRIEEQYSGTSVEIYLIKTHGFSRRIITRLKREPEHILCNGKHVRMVDIVKTGDILTVILEETNDLLPNSELSVPIIYEDEDIIIFDKPAQMPVHPSLRHVEDTLGNFFSAYLESKCEKAGYHPLNRLDADTTGLCLVAKHSLSAGILSGKVEKEYTAVVCGNLPWEHGIIDRPIARCSDSMIQRKVDPSGKKSITEFWVEQRKNNYTVVRVKLHTGRTHQIRVHFSDLGYPLAGDDMYGGSLKDIRRQALCCTRLIFQHPILHKQMNFCIKIQNDIHNILK